MAAPQAYGITRSLQKLAMAIVSMASTGSPTTVDRMRHPPAPANPEHATIRRRFALFPESSTLTGFAMPPAKHGRMLNNVVEAMVKWRPSLRYVGSQVM